MELFPENPTEPFEYTVSIPWMEKPTVKERPRFANGRVYTPAKTLKNEKHIAAAWAEHNLPVIDEPCEIELEFTNAEMKITLRNHEPYENRSVRGDLDNVCKLVLDALNEVAYTDDKYIVELKARKI